MLLSQGNEALLTKLGENKGGRAMTDSFGVSLKLSTFYEQCFSWATWTS